MHFDIEVVIQKALADAINEQTDQGFQTGLQQEQDQVGCLKPFIQLETGSHRISMPQTQGAPGETWLQTQDPQID